MFLCRSYEKHKLTQKTTAVCGLLLTLSSLFSVVKVTILNYIPSLTYCVFLVTIEHNLFLQTSSDNTNLLQFCLLQIVLIEYFCSNMQILLSCCHFFIAPFATETKYEAFCFGSFFCQCSLVSRKWQLLVDIATLRDTEKEIRAKNMYPDFFLSFDLTFFQQKPEKIMEEKQTRVHFHAENTQENHFQAQETKVLFYSPIPIFIQNGKERTLYF